MLSQCLASQVRLRLLRIKPDRHMGDQAKLRGRHSAVIRRIWSARSPYVRAVKASLHTETRNS